MLAMMLSSLESRALYAVPQVHLTNCYFAPVAAAAAVGVDAADAADAAGAADVVAVVATGAAAASVDVDDAVGRASWARSLGRELHQKSCCFPIATGGAPVAVLVSEAKVSAAAAAAVAVVETGEANDKLGLLAVHLTAPGWWRAAF
jgi:hypothetical protein